MSDNDRAFLSSRLSLTAIGRRSWQVVGLVLALAAGTWLITQLAVVVVAIIVASFIAATFSPAVEFLHRRSWARTPAALAVTIGWILGLIIVFSLVGWRFAAQLPELVDQVSSALSRLREEYPQLPLGSSRLQDLLDRARESASQGLPGGLRSLGEVLSGAALAIVLSFFFLRDGSSMWRWFISLFQPARGQRIDDVGRAGFATVAQYVRGLTVVAAADAVLSAIGLFLLGVPLASALVVLTFLGAFIPAVGAFVVGGLAVALAFADGGTTNAVIVLILYTVIQQVDGNILQPYVMGHRLPLHPAVVLIALTLGGLQAGIVGAFLAVPLTAAAAAAAREFLALDPAGSTTDER